MTNHQTTEGSTGTKTEGRSGTLQCRRSSISDDFLSCKLVAQPRRHGTSRKKAFMVRHVTGRSFISTVENVFVPCDRNIQNVATIVCRISDQLRGSVGRYQFADPSHHRVSWSIEPYVQVTRDSEGHRE